MPMRFGARFTTPGQPYVINEVIARRIISLARQGERDVDKLCEGALGAALGSKAVY
jgi:hypothetical protein